MNAGVLRLCRCRRARRRARWEPLLTRFNGRPGENRRVSTGMARKGEVRNAGSRMFVSLMSRVETAWRLRNVEVNGKKDVEMSVDKEGYANGRKYGRASGVGRNGKVAEKRGKRGVKVKPKLWSSLEGGGIYHQILLRATKLLCMEGADHGYRVLLLVATTNKQQRLSQRGPLFSGGSVDQNRKELRVVVNRRVHPLPGQQQLAHVNRVGLSTNKASVVIKTSSRTTRRETRYCGMNPMMVVL